MKLVPVFISVAHMAVDNVSRHASHQYIKQNSLPTIFIGELQLWSSWPVLRAMWIIVSSHMHENMSRVFLARRCSDKVNISCFACWDLQASGNVSAASTPKHQYGGAVSQAVKAIGNVAFGGQVLMDRSTMEQLAAAREAILAEFKRPCSAPGTPRE